MSDEKHHQKELKLEIKILETKLELADKKVEVAEWVREGAERKLAELGHSVYENLLKERFKKCP